MKRAASKIVRPLLLIACLFHAAVAFGAGPVYLHESGSSLVLGNDYLERTISTAEGQAGTTRFVNKISGRAYTLGGPEFAVKLITERVGYDFGDENPKVITARSLRLLDHAAEDLPGGGQAPHPALRPHPDQRPRPGVARPARGRGLRAQARRFLHAPVAASCPSRSRAPGSWIGSRWPATNGACRDFPWAASASRSSRTISSWAWNIPPAINTANGTEVDSRRLRRPQHSRRRLHQRARGVRRRARRPGPPPVPRLRRPHARRARPPVPALQLLVRSAAPRHEPRQHARRACPILQKLLLQKYGLHLDSFVLDDGWDDMQQALGHRPEALPRRLPRSRERAAGHRQPAGPLVRPHRRLRSARRPPRHRQARGHGDHLRRPVPVHRRQELQPPACRHHAEIPEGIRHQLFQDRRHRLRLQRAGSRPSGGHLLATKPPRARSSPCSSKLRAQDPNVFLNITTSIWLSPWWLRYADTVWMGGADSGYLPSVPTLAPAPERRQLQGFRALRRFRGPPGAVPHLLADDPRHHQGQVQHAGRQAGIPRRLARRGGPLLQRRQHDVRALHLARHPLRRRNGRARQHHQVGRSQRPSAARQLHHGAGRPGPARALRLSCTPRRTAPS